MVENVSKDDSEQGGNGNDARGLDVKQLFFSDFVATISSNHIITTAYSLVKHLNFMQARHLTGKIRPRQTLVLDRISP